MSRLNDILDFVVGIQQTLTVTVDGNALTTVKRKLPKREETVDPAYQVTVSGAERVDEVRPIAFGGNYRVPYVIEITLITPNDKDQLRGLVDHTTWLEATRAKYLVPGMMASVGGVNRVDVIQAPMLDRSQLREGYDYTQVVLRVSTFETRSS